MDVGRVLLWAMVVGACAPEIEEPPILFEGPVGSAEGRICAPDGHGFAPGILVTAVVQDLRVETHTDVDGRFSFEALPVGEHTFRVGGPLLGFDLPITVEEDRTTRWTKPQCLRSDELVVVGIAARDRVGDAARRVGMRVADYDPLYAHLFSYRLPDVDILMVGCGAAPPDVPELRDWVSSGGVIVVTDWSAGELERLFPGTLELGETTGHAGTYPVTMTDPDMAGGVLPPKTSARFGNKFALPGPDGSTVVATTRAPAWFEGPMVEAAAVVTRPFGEGKLIYFGFHIDQEHPHAPDLLVRNLLLSL